MQGNRYEVHSISNSMLPFIFHWAVEANLRGIVNWHENLEILYCEEGCGTVKYNEKDIPFQPGDMVVINSDIMHCVQPEDRCVHHCFIIDRAFCESNGIPVTALYFQEKIRDPQLNEVYLEIFRAYHTYGKEHAFYGPAQIRAKATELLYLLCSRYILPQKGPVKQSSTDAVKSAVLYIKQNYAQHITLELLAAHVGISRCYLAREFKKYTGKTVFGMLMRTRCKEARRMLQDGATVSQAAFACGFESLSYFSKTFKKVYGITPTQCIKK